MNSSRPRPSVLSLFDPLSETPEPSTPPRNESPTVDSDKENDNPPRNELTLTTFFNRTYKTQHTPPKPLTRRLIDVGDITFNNVDLGNDEEEDGLDAWNEFDEDENNTLTFRQMAAAATPKWTTPKASDGFAALSPSYPPRTPLAELPIEEEETPVFRKVHTQPFTSSKLAQVESSLHIVITEPQDPPEELLSSTRQPNKGPAATETRTNNLSAGPLACSASSLNTLNLSTMPTPDESLFNEATGPAFYSLPTSSELSLERSFDTSSLRPTYPKTSSSDQSRYSIDLQSSFQLHLDSEGTFDLLNDKISFFDPDKNGMESSAHDFDEGSFDLGIEQAKLDALAISLTTKPCQAQTEVIYDVAPSDNEDDEDHQPHGGCSINNLSKITDRGVETRPQSDDSQVSIVKPPPVKANPDLNVAQNDLASVVLPPTPKQEAATPVRGTATPRNMRTIPIAPPPVPALRIVKRSKLAIQKAASMMHIGKPQDAPSPKEKKPVVASQGPSPLIPQAQARALNVTTSKISRTSISRTDISRENTAPITRRPPASEGARRVLVDQQGAKPSITARGANTGRGTSSTVTGPRRVPIVNTVTGVKSTTATTRQVNPPISGLPKSTSRSTSMASAIPQSTARSGVSRVPAPSVVVRSATVSGRDTRGAPLRRVI